MRASWIRGASLLLLVCMVLGCTASAGAVEKTMGNSTATMALAIDNLPTRSGPSTAYRETGTYKVKGQQIRLLSYAYDDGGVCWVQCEVPYGGALRRVYTGLKRFDAATVDLSTLPAEDPLTFARVRVLATSKALYGPGPEYGPYGKLTVDKGQKVSIVATDGEYALVEWTTTKQSYRAWVTLDTLDN